MRRRDGLMAGVAALVLAAGGALVPPPAPAGATAAWPGLEAQALHAVAMYLGSGPVGSTGSPTGIASSTVTTGTGQTISVQQQTVPATDSAGNLVVGLSLLGGQQLVVTEQDPTGAQPGATLVLSPGSVQVAQVRTLPRLVRRTASGTILRADDSGSGAGGCGGYPAPPGVVNSVFGPLIMGPGVVACYYSPESIGVFAQIYENPWGNSRAVGNAGGGSTYGTFLVENSYAPCYAAGYNTYFITAELWSLNGNLAGGATSSVASLNCAQM
jgi:hypothetical protein